ncbi:hypothetical protein ACOME3_008433 [Neoechinorhynchus agilis]
MMNPTRLETSSRKNYLPGVDLNNNPEIIDYSYIQGALNEEKSGIRHSTRKLILMERTENFYRLPEVQLNSDEMFRQVLSVRLANL